MKSRQRFWSLRLGKQWILVGLLGLSLLAGCATPSQNPYMYTGAGLGAALGAQEVELFGRFDPLGGGGDAEAVGEARNRRDDRRAVAPLSEVFDERAVDLDLVERKAGVLSTPTAG